MAAGALGTGALAAGGNDAQSATGSRKCAILPFSRID